MSSSHLDPGTISVGKNFLKERLLGFGRIDTVGCLVTESILGLEDSILEAGEISILGRIFIDSCGSSGLGKVRLREDFYTCC